MIPTTRVLRMRIYPLWNDVRVSLTAAVERAHSDRARSGSKRLTRASFQSTFLCAGRFQQPLRLNVHIHIRWHTIRSLLVRHPQLEPVGPFL